MKSIQEVRGSSRTNSLPPSRLRLHCSPSPALSNQDSAAAASHLVSFSSYPADGGGTATHRICHAALGGRVVLHQVTWRCWGPQRQDVHHAALKLLPKALRKVSGPPVLPKQLLTACPPPPNTHPPAHVRVHAPPPRVNVEDMTVEEMTAAHYLAFKEKLVALPGGELVGGSGRARARRGACAAPSPPPPCLPLTLLLPCQGPCAHRLNAPRPAPAAVSRVSRV